MMRVQFRQPYVAAHNCLEFQFQELWYSLLASMNNEERKREMEREKEGGREKIKYRSGSVCVCKIEAFLEILMSFHHKESCHMYLNCWSVWVCKQMPLSDLLILYIQ